MAQGYAFDEQSVRLISQMLKWWQGQGGTRAQRRGRGPISAPCLPSAVDTTIDHTGGSEETAQTDTWEIGTDGSLDLTICVRVAYDPEGDKIIYAFYRTLTYDVLGRLVNVTAETRVIVDTLVECT
jgi:hypothetical protein